MPLQKIKPKTDVFDPPDRRAWREWLIKNHDSSKGIWVAVRKENSLRGGVPLSEVVEEVLCFGWIDSRLNVKDYERYILWLSSRKPKSTWSKSNKQRVENLIQLGLMMPAGMKKIEEAKNDGSWNTLDMIEQLKIPDDLKKAFAVDKGT